MYYKIRTNLDNKIIFGVSKTKLTDERRFIKITDEAKTAEINKALDDGYEVILDKDDNIINKTPINNFGIMAHDKDKYKITKMLNEYLSSRVNSKSIIDYIDYIDIKAELDEAGYIITNNNKEEKYLEILETGDEHLIDLLEEFLIIKDNLSLIKSARKLYKNLMEELKSTPESDKDALNKIKNSIPL
jgi:hypothetical protein